MEESGGGKRRERVDIYIMNSTYKENDIKNKVQKAIQQYVLWQKQQIGRDINPSELIKQVMQAGAKRVEIVQPDFQEISHTELAQCKNKTVIYGGLEYD